MSGQIIDASLVSAPKQRNTDAEKKDVKEGRIPEIRKEHPAKLRQKDRDARWTLVFGKVREREDGTRHADIASGLRLQKPRQHRPAPRVHPEMGRDRRQPTRWEDASSRPPRQNEHWHHRLGRQRLSLEGDRSLHRRHGSQGRPMAPHIRRGNAARSKVRAAIEHVFAQQKGPMALCIRTVGIARAKVKIGLANLTYNIRRLVFHERSTALA
jgi:transposase, IS5 family